MSATGRENQRNLFGSNRDPRDFYRTPAGCVRAILPWLPVTGEFVDAGCGDGAILGELVASGRDAIGLEKDPYLARAAAARFPSLDVVVEGDFLSSSWGATDAVVMNPPYGISLDFVRRALEIVEPRRGIVAALLRLNWLGSRARADFLEAHPCDVFVLTPRPRFTKQGSDACEYAWLVWGPNRGGRWQILRWQP